MSTTPEPATAQCRVCQSEVPAGAFCGLCGVHLAPERGDGPPWLRIRTYGAGPKEHLLQPAVASSLFPHLPPRSRGPFRIGLVVVLVALTAAALLRMPAVLIAVAALGIPLLFVVYLQESDADHDVPVRTWLLTAALGIGLGVGFVLLTGAAVARSYDVALGVAGLLRMGIGVPLVGLILMLVPAIAVRLLRPPTREALDGFIIGALGALAFHVGAALTRLAPQFSVGLVSRGRPMASLLVEAGIQGVAVPLTMAACGGLVGTALWFTRPPGKAHQRPGVVRIVLVLCALAVLVVVAALGVIDVARFPQLVQLCLYLAVTAAALLALRVGLHLALLHEQHDGIHADLPLLCPYCDHVVPDMAFCPACGVATRASSRSSRAARREFRPVRAEQP